MSFADVLFLYRARLRARNVLVQECFAILGIAVGVALLFASQVASTSLARSVAELSNQLVGNTQFQLDARGPGGFNELLLGDVRRIPGVRVALPVLEQQVTVIGPRGERSVDLIGTDPRFAGLAGSLLRRFSAAQIAAQQAIALPVPVAHEIGVGSLQTAKLQVGARVVTTLVGATLDESEIAGLVHSPVALAPVGYGQRITGMEGRITRIFVRAQNGHYAQVQAALDRFARRTGLDLEPADYDSKLFAVAAAPQTKSQTLFSVISALVGFMFALNAMLITVPARRRLIDDIRLQGANRRMALQILLFDALVIGVLACVIGLAVGDLLSIAVFHSTPGYLSFAFPIGNNRIVTWSSVALAVLAGMAAATIGVLWPLRASLVHQSQRDGARGNRPRLRNAVVLIGGLVSLALTTVILVVSPAQASIGSITLIIALLCLMPLLFDAFIDIFEWLQRPFNGAAPIIAVTELRTPPTRVRSLAIAATGAVSVFGIVAIQGAQGNLERGLQRSARAVDSAAVVWVVTGGEFDAFATTQFPSNRAATLAHAPGVARLGVYRGSFLNWGDRRLWVLAPPVNSEHPLSSSQLLVGDVGPATARFRKGGWAVLSQALATERGLRIGDAFTLPSPRPVRLRVAALSTNLGWPSGAMILNSTDYAQAWASSAASAYAIEIKSGFSAQEVRRAVQRALGPESGLVVETATERERRHYALADQGLSRLSQIRLLVLIAAVLAIGSAMAALIWQRRDLVSFIKCEGYRQGVLWRWLLCESALLLAAGCSIGAVFGLYGQLLLSHALMSVTGFPMVFHVGISTALSSFGLIAAMAVAIVAVAGYLVVRTPPKAVSPAY